MKIGPINPIVFGRLRDLLEAKGHEFDVQIDEGVKEDPRLAVPSSDDPVLPRRQYVAAEPYITIDISDQAFEDIRSELERFELMPPTDEFEMMDDPEYHCPRCDHTQDSPARCPKHGLVLVSFEEWAALRRQSGEQAKGVFGWIALVVGVIAAIIYFSRK
ncbi:MAG TPA: hypothetical protein VM432_08710 [Bdellovibrionales bacterium]|nr:hypothetical protein [Bdellovibrionales bacterium]